MKDWTPPLWATWAVLAVALALTPRACDSMLAPSPLPQEVTR